MPEWLAWCQGRCVPLSEAALPWMDAGFVYGAVVVDNARTFRRRLFLWPRHLERLRRHCQLCHIPLPHSDTELTVIADHLVTHNGQFLPAEEEIQVVTFVTPGPLGWLTGEEHNGPPTVGMMTYPLPRQRYRRFFSEGVTLEIVGHQHAHPNDILPPAIKHRSRLMWYLAEQRKHHPCSVPVLVNQQGIGDTAVGTIVAVSHGTILLPPAEWVLESISVQFLRELCQSQNIPVEESPRDVRHLWEPQSDAAETPLGKSISELLLVGTAFCIAGVRRLVSPSGERIFPWPGAMYSLLLAAWESYVGTPIARSFLKD
jgi:branched-chain amino acid aminotransferase